MKNTGQPVLKPHKQSGDFLNNFYTRRKMLGIVLILPTIILLMVFIAYPVLSNLFLSFTDATLSRNQSNFIGFGNFVKLLSNPRFFNYSWNTLVWTFFSVIGQLAVGLGLALLINRQMRGGAFLRSFLLIPYVVPAIALALITRWLCDGDYGIVSNLLQNIGLIGYKQSPLAIPGSAMTILILVNIWRSYPFPMLIYWAALKGIDKEMYEAANVDGASKLQTFLYIVLPQLRNTTLVLAILRIVWTATYFDLIWMVTGGGPAGTTTHLPIMIYQSSFGTFQFGYASAISIVLGLGLLVCIVFYVKKSGDFAD
ncbi:MAG: sugar ABC transporter permease [Treponema sp.]|nr:sugar ABC transporter permease [Treponema sp.]